MKRALVFASRNTKEILRDLMTILFGFGFPLVILFLLSAINRGIPAQAQMNLFDIKNLVPGVVVFGLSFISLFTAVLVSKDRSSSFILRLFTSPLKPSEYIVGYTLPLVPVALAQTLVCYIAALPLGLDFSICVLLSAMVNLPAVVLFISIGLLCGTVFNDKAVGGVCGGLLTNLSAWLSGTWFDLSLVGGGFVKVADLLPFTHAVNAGRYALKGDFASALPEVLWVSGYAFAVMVIAVVIFSRKMKKDK